MVLLKSWNQLKKWKILSCIDFKVVVKFSRRGFLYKLQKTPVVPMNVNSNAFVVNDIVFKTADWLETHL
jgi:hypothetical protein